MRASAHERPRACSHTHTHTHTLFTLPQLLYYAALVCNPATNTTQFGEKCDPTERTKPLIM